ncbi:hypothetical protein RQP46_001362 [Phenoliferia psychrophenolica]
MKRARELDAHLRKTGSVVGPLHGLPISLKEQFDIEGVEQTMGFVSQIGHISSKSAAMVTMLEGLGAVIHCRTNLPQTLLCDESVNNVFGRTLNPWNTDLTAGGSSGGEAALLAMKGSIIGIGTDLESLESVCGPMARSRRSVEIIMKAILTDVMVSKVVVWHALDHAGAQEIVSKIFDADGGEDVRQWLGDSGEPILPQVFTSQHPAMTIHESWQMSDLWQGPESLALAFDIGTTQSAASIVHLLPNQPIKVRVVSRWPSSPNSSKIPTTILYNARGAPKAFGAETKDDAHADEGYNECKVRPSLSQGPNKLGAAAPGPSNAPAPLQGPTSFEVPPLPPNVTIEQAYSDFIKYLFDNTKHAPQRTTAFYAAHQWPTAYHSIQEQAALKRAITRSGVLRGASVENHVVFVTESEASVHFGILYRSNKQSEWLSPSSTLAVVDAGGSTVDICVYEVTQTHPKLQLREAKTSDCTQSGAIFVSRAAEQIIKQKLGNSKFNTPEFVAAMVEGFDAKTKIMFDSVDENYLIKFGFDRDTDRAAGISRGRLALTGAEVKRAFDPCVDKIIASLRDQISGTRVKSILVVGGFGESLYLQRRLRETFEKNGTRVVTADEPSKKAVAEGGALFFAKDSIIGRATRFEFGIEVTRRIDGGWSVIVKNGAIVGTDEVHRKQYSQEFSGGKHTTSVDIFTYSGLDGISDHQGWCTSPEGYFYPKFVKACTVKANLSALAATTPPKINPVTNAPYKRLSFDICFFFGGTSLRAEVRWEINGVEHRSEASVVPSSFF